MRRQDFHYDLPRELIAQYPRERRSESRLLVLDPAIPRFRDSVFERLPTFLNAGDLLVFNDTRVIPARLYARKSTGGAVEILVEKLLSPRRMLAQLRASRSPEAGQQLFLDENIRVAVVGRRDALFELQTAPDDEWPGILDQLGHVPLPPYIRRPDEALDRERYQTVYARSAGAVAAPTAGLHFDEKLLGRLKALGVRTGFLTLHVGAGTFQPVRSEQVEDHRVHEEHVEVSEELCALVAATRAAGRRVIAVGTTTVRALESAVQANRLIPFYGDTSLYIYPGYRFRMVDALITNFHLPESSLLMLVCAFGGFSRVMATYAHAVQQKYRFYSYGDAMFVTARGTQMDLLS